jgi:hypothetical protein
MVGAFEHSPWHLPKNRETLEVRPTAEKEAGKAIAWHMKRGG